MWETIRGYLTFTKKERFGVLFLFILVTVLFVLPYFFRPSVGDSDPAAYEKMKSEIQKYETSTADSSAKQNNHERYQNSKTFSRFGSSEKKGGDSDAELFYFDPNKIQAADWARLGLTEHLAQTILHYIERGGRFQRAEDLKKLYGLHNSDYERLFPYVRISKSPELSKVRARNDTKSEYPVSYVKRTDSFFHKTFLRNLAPGRITKEFLVTDVNLADSAGWSRLPGIGAKLASRIIHFREKLGGFYEPDQLAETFGLPDSTFQKIKPFLVIHSVSLNQMDLNTATKEMLESHPYIRWQIANAIIRYRQQHGLFQSVDELLQLAQMDSLKFKKLKPYLFVKQFTRQ
jgi:competence protein ComEA